MFNFGGYGLKNNCKEVGMEKKKVFACLGFEAGLALLYLFFWNIGIKQFIPEQDFFLIKNVYLALAFLSMSLLGFVELYRDKKKKSKMEVCFFWMLLIIGIMYQLVLPAFSAPDEDTHFASAYRLSNRMMKKQETDAKGYTVMREEDRKGQTYTYGEKEFAGYYRKMFSTEKVDSQTVSYIRKKAEQTVPFPVYLAPACGITVARLLHWNGVWTAYSARICSLLFVALSGAVSYRLLPFAKQNVMILCCMPMSLSLISSISYDGFHLAVILLFFSIAMNCAYAREKVTWKEIAALLVTAVCFVPVKLIYFPFLWLVFFVPPKKFKQKKTAWFTYGIINLLPVLEAVWLKTGKISFIASGTTNLTAKDGYTLFYVVGHLCEIIKFISYNVFFIKGDEMAESFAGRSLGWLDTKIPRYLAYSFVFLLFLNVLTETYQASILKWQKALAFAAAGIQICLPVFVMFLAETARSDSKLACVQGRYFLPIALLLPFLTQNRKFMRKKTENNVLLERTLIYLNSFSVIMTLHSVLRR